MNKTSNFIMKKLFFYIGSISLIFFVTKNVYPSVTTILNSGWNSFPPSEQISVLNLLHEDNPYREKTEEVL